MGKERLTVAATSPPMLVMSAPTLPMSSPMLLLSSWAAAMKAGRSRMRWESCMVVVLFELEVDDVFVLFV